MLIDKEKLWKVALDEMNQVHYEEVDIVNDIYATLTADSTKEVILEKLNGFRDHTIAHFSNEERMMQEHSFFAYGCHKGAHDDALKRIDELIENFIKDSDIGTLKKYFDTELIQWLQGHITTMDTVTAQFLSQQ